jgi:hypothetical protein
MGYTSAPFDAEKLRHLIGEKFHGSVAFFARNVGVEPQTVWRWLKTGRMNPEKFEIVVKTLDVTPAELKSADAVSGVLRSLDLAIRNGLLTTGVVRQRLASHDAAARAKIEQRRKGRP